MVAADLLALLVCPETHQDLRLATPAEMKQINQAIAAGLVQSVSGETSRQQPDGALIRQDGLVGYPIREGIPVLLIAEGLRLDKLNLKRS